MVVDHRAPVSSAGQGRAFWKMSGSGNDFLFFDSRGRGTNLDPLETPTEIAALCRSHIGVGADGVVFVVDAEGAPFGIRYYNADGSRATLCGNASLCTAQSAVRLGLTVREQMFHFMSDAGQITALIDAAGTASVRLSAVTALETVAAERPALGELRIGFAAVGVPHLVVLVTDLAAIDVAGRGRSLRHGDERAPAGANVNFVSAAPGSGEWRIRTYERGVEAETYACGTGAIATAACLRAWSLTTDDHAGTRLRTASGRVLTVRLPDAPDAGWSELSGEGRIVHDGVLREYS